MKKIISLPLLLLVLLTGSVHAQTKKAGSKKQQVAEVAPPEMEALENVKINALPLAMLDTTLAPDDELTRELKRMLTTCDAIGIMVATAEDIMSQQKAANAGQGMDAFFDRFLKEIKSPRVYRLFENIFVKIYRNHFTVAEIKALNEFYGTPLGKKSLQVTPLIMQQSQVEGGKLGQLLAMEIMEKMQAEESN